MHRGKNMGKCIILHPRCNLCDQVKNEHVTYLSHFTHKISPSWTNTLWCFSVAASLNYLSHFSQKSPSWTDTIWCLSVAAALNYSSHFSQKISPSWTNTLWCLSLPPSLNNLSQTVQPTCAICSQWSEIWMCTLQ